MPFFSVIFWSAALLFVGGGLVIFGTLSVKAWRRKWPVLKWVFSAFFGLFALIATYGIGGHVYGCYLDSLPEVAFRRAFHREPNGVQLLHGHSGHFIDSSGIDIAFQTDRRTFDALRPEKMDRGTLEDYRRLDIYKPKWWRRPGETSEIWVSQDEDTTTVMTWDGDGLVQYYWAALY